MFPALGDWGDNGSNGKKRQQYVADIMDKWCEDRGCNFIMSTGDNFYPDGAESVDDDRFQDSWKNVYDGDSLKDLVMNLYCIVVELTIYLFAGLLCEISPLRSEFQFIEFLPV